MKMGGSINGLRNNWKKSEIGFMKTVGIFEVMQVVRMQNMGVILHGAMQSGSLQEGDYIQFMLNGGPEIRPIAAASVAGHLPGGRYRYDLHIVFDKASDRGKFHLNSIPKGMAQIIRP